MQVKPGDPVNSGDEIFKLKEGKLSTKLLIFSYFCEIISKSKFALQCSFSESFNYFVSDCLMCNTPVITSKEIDWNPIKNLVVDKIDPIQIKDKMEYIAELHPNTDYIDIKLWKKGINQKNNKIKEILDLI